MNPWVRYKEKRKHMENEGRNEKMKNQNSRSDFHPKLEMLFSNFVLPTCPLTKFFEI